MGQKPHPSLSVNRLVRLDHNTNRVGGAEAPPFVERYSLPDGVTPAEAASVGQKPHPSLSVPQVRRRLNQLRERRWGRSPTLR